MKKLRIAAALVLLCGLAISVQAQDDQGKDGSTRTLEAAVLPACTDLDSDNLLVGDLADAVTNGTIFCREIAHDRAYLVNPGVIGNQGVIERGVRQAYDVFGLTVEGVSVGRFDRAITVCLRGRGEMIFLPAFAAPRPAQTPQTYPHDEFTCTRIGSPGIVALVAG